MLIFFDIRNCIMYYDLKYVLFFTSTKELNVEVEWNIKIFFVHKLDVNHIKPPEHFVNPRNLKDFK